MTRHALQCTSDTSTVSARNDILSVNKCAAHPPSMLLISINPLNAELNPICQLLALLGAHHILNISRIRVNMALVPVKNTSMLYTLYNQVCKGQEYC